MFISRSTAYLLHNQLDPSHSFDSPHCASTVVMMTGKINQTRLAILKKKEEEAGSAEYNRRPSTQDKTINLY